MFYMYLWGLFSQQFAVSQCVVVSVFQSALRELSFVDWGFRNQVYPRVVVSGQRHVQHPAYGYSRHTYQMWCCLLTSFT